MFENQHHLGIRSGHVANVCDYCMPDCLISAPGTVVRGSASTDQGCRQFTPFPASQVLIKHHNHLPFVFLKILRRHLLPGYHILSAHRYTNSR